LKAGQQTTQAHLTKCGILVEKQVWGYSSECG
jgi:hypothetical protein